MTLHHHHQELNVINFSAVTDPILVFGSTAAKWTSTRTPQKTTTTTATTTITKSTILCRSLYYSYLLNLEQALALYIKWGFTRLRLRNRSLHHFILSHLGSIFLACHPLFNQVAIVWIRKALFKFCFLKNLFSVPGCLQGCGLRYCFNFCCQSTIFWSPLLSPN